MARAVCGAKMTIRAVAATVTTVTNPNACVTLIHAARACERDMCTAATTEHPTPINSPNPVNSNITGTHIFTAAMPSLPTPWPMKMPSTAVTAEMLNIPNSVGKNIRRKSVDTSSVPRSIEFLSIVFHFYPHGGRKGCYPHAGRVSTHGPLFTRWPPRTSMHPHLDIPAS